MTLVTKDTHYFCRQRLIEESKYGLAVGTIAFSDRPIFDIRPRVFSDLRNLRGGLSLKIFVFCCVDRLHVNSNGSARRLAAPSLLRFLLIWTGFPSVRTQVRMRPAQ